MKPFETADLARAIANVANAMGVASTVTMTEALTATITEMFTKQLRERNVIVAIQHTEEGYFAGLVQERVTDLLKAAQDSLRDSQLPQRFHGKLERIMGNLASLERFDGIEAKARIDELQQDLIAELSEPMFLRIQPERRSLYEQKIPPFGPLVFLTYSDANRDIEAAARCLALDEWTACVFHCMRVLEHGLRQLAQRFNVSFAQDSWHKVIKGIEDGIEAFRNKGNLTDKDRSDITFYSEAATQFRYFKDAWRNHVSHARVHYDDREADRVYQHVGDFMQHMATMP